MIRLLGFMAGSAITVGTMLLVMGLPEFRAEPASERPAATNAEASAAAPRTPELYDEPFDETFDEPDGDPAAEDDERAAASGLPRAPDDRLRANAPPGPMSVPEAPGEPLHDERLSSSGLSPPGPSSPEAVRDGGDPLWHSFWNPFRSEIAANGFAARLSSVTGIDYRVVRLKPGSYQVAFAYADDDERRTKISQIETATGLNLPEDAP